jgi:8-oxo-dGTP pyrophosphatase MutT (NUDIX family)
MYVNARAIIERETPSGIEILVQTRVKPHEGGVSIELPGGQVREYESLVGALRREVREETGLTVTHVEGLNARVEARGQDTCVECLSPFAAYQTTAGPVDSMGVYFRCRAEGDLLDIGDDAEGARWVSLPQVAEWLERAPDTLSWVDRAGMLFYLSQAGEQG